MVNMYSMGMYGMYGMPTMYGANGIYNAYGMGGNAHQQLKNCYGVGYENFGSSPYAQPYPFAIVPRRQEPPCEENAFCRFLKKCFK